MSTDTNQQFNQQPTLQLIGRNYQLCLPLNLEPRVAIPTADAAFHLNRKCQTLRVWACLENGPIRPMRICGRLAWPVADIRKLLNQEAAC